MKKWKIIGLALLLASMVSMASTSVLASVVLTGTRMIYPGNAHEKSIQLTNQDSTPSVMQVWVDSGDEGSTPETADAPFLVTPPLFRIEPNEGQLVRVVFTGEGLPQDRESVFYLNTMQIPSTDAANADRNQMVVMLRNRIKLFYRPTGIKGNVEHVTDQLRFDVRQEGEHWRVTAENLSAYYISMLGAKVISNEHEFPFEPGMIAPFSTLEWVVKSSGLPVPLSLKVRYVFINDYGGSIESEFKTGPAVQLNGK
jgi:fimbrial chaperone protein